MPFNKHLNWMDIADFTAGLHSERGAQELAAPEKSFSVMQDCYAIPDQGGVRAWYKNNPLSTSPIPNTQGIAGLWTRDGTPRRDGTAADATDHLIVTVDNSDFKWRIWRMDGSNLETTWKTEFTSAAGSATGHQCAGIVYFKESGGAIYYLVSFFGNVGTGLYKLAYVPGAGPPAGDGVVTNINAFGGPICISQSRIMIGSGNDETLNYGPVASTSASGWGSLLVAPNRQEPNISIISNIEPADLIIGKEGAPWVEINGDVSQTSTPVREMGDGHYQRQDKQQVPRSPEGGIIFVEGNGRIWETDGRTFTCLSLPVPRFNLNNANGLVGPGQLAVLNGFLFAPGGLVYNFDTKAWHSVSYMAGSLYHYADPYGGFVEYATDGTGFSMGDVNVFEGASNSGKRVSSYVLQTVPFADPAGDNVVIRECQWFIQCYSGSNTLTVKLIDQTGSVVDTKALTGLSGRVKISSLHPNTMSDYLSVQVTVSSDDGTSEAPTLERMRVGFGPTNKMVK